MNEAPILSAVCHEPDIEPVERFVYPMPLSMENLKIFWEKARQFRTIFRTEINDDFHKFVELFISDDGGGNLRSHGLFWRIDDFVGIYYMTRITEVECDVHYSFFDRRHKGRELLTKKMLAYAFDRFQFKRMNVEVPMYATKHTFGFTQAIGFKKEGVKRSCIEYKGEWFDATYYGLLREEALNVTEI